MQWVVQCTLYRTVQTDNSFSVLIYISTYTLPAVYRNCVHHMFIANQCTGRTAVFQKTCIYIRPTRGSSFFLGKVTALGVLCCFALFVCLTLLASFFLPSHLSLKKMYIHMEYIYMYMRQLIFSRKSDCLGCAVLLCLVCLFDLACFFLSSFSSLI